LNIIQDLTEMKLGASNLSLSPSVILYPSVDCIMEMRSPLMAATRSAATASNKRGN